MCGVFFSFFDLYCSLSLYSKKNQKKLLKNLTLTDTIRKFTIVKNSDWAVREHTHSRE